MTRRFADFSRSVHHVSAGEAIGMPAGIITLISADRLSHMPCAD